MNIHFELWDGLAGCTVIQTFQATKGINDGEQPFTGPKRKKSKKEKKLDSIKEENGVVKGDEANPVNGDSTFQNEYDLAVNQGPNKTSKVSIFYFYIIYCIGPFLLKIQQNSTRFFL